MIHRLLHRLLSDVPLLDEAGFIALAHGTLPKELFANDVQLAEHPYLTQVRQQLKPKMQVRDDGVAIVPIHGVLARKPDVFEMLYYGAEDLNSILEMCDSAARNPDVRGVLYDIDSPGGFMTGGPEVADVISYTNGIKPTVAFSGGSCASLAYWMASQAGQLVGSRSAAFGSIGGFMAHVDRSKMLETIGVKVEVIKNKEADLKAAGLLGTSLTDAQREHLQQRVQAGFEEFRRAVTSKRPQVKAEAMRGQTLSGAEAKAAGLIDRVGDASYAMSTLKADMRRRG